MTESVSPTEGERAPVITSPGYLVRRAAYKGRWEVYSISTGRTARLQPEQVQTLAHASDATYHPGLPSNSRLDKRVQDQAVQHPWEAGYEVASLLSDMGDSIVAKLLPDTLPVPMVAYEEAIEEVRRARTLLFERERAADEQWEGVMAAVGALPAFEDMSLLASQYGRSCLASPIGVCIYNQAEDPEDYRDVEDCVVCSLPSERK